MYTQTYKQLSLCTEGCQIKGAQSGALLLYNAHPKTKQRRVFDESISCC